VVRQLRLDSSNGFNSGALSIEPWRKPLSRCVGNYLCSLGLSGTSRSREPCARGCESACPDCLCSVDQQSQMGHGSRKCGPLGASHGTTQGFCSQRLSNRHPGQRSPNRAGWETPAPKAGVTAFWNRRCAWKVVVLAPLLSHLTSSTRILSPVISPVRVQGHNRKSLSSLGQAYAP
jgi:hypothetical protein